MTNDNKRRLVSRFIGEFNQSQKLMKAYSRGLINLDELKNSKDYTWIKMMLDDFTAIKKILK